MVLLAFSHLTFLKSGSICPAGPAAFARLGNFCRVGKRARQLSPGRIFHPNAKSMFNQTLPPFGTAIANAHAGKTPKEQLLDTPERRDQNVF
jgi:hypothetical protein